MPSDTGQNISSAKPIQDASGKSSSGKSNLGKNTPSQMSAAVSAPVSALKSLAGSQIRLAQKRAVYNPFYGRMVTFFKLLLPTIAFTLIIGVIVWPLLEEGKDFDTFFEDPDIDSTKLQVFDATYGGFGKEGNPYTITADRAIQNDPEIPVFDLEAPKGDVLFEDGNWYAVNAPKGRMDQTANMLELWGGVDSYQDQGLEFHTERMQLDLKDKSGYSDTPVEGIGQDVYITAEGIRIHSKGEQVDLLGKSKIIFTGTGKSSNSDTQ